MHDFKEITPEELNINPFTLIGAEWMLIAAEKEGKVNAMTASWGGLGVIWEKNVAYIVLRPQRYTKEFVDHSETFSLNFFEDSYKKQMAYIGEVSGRDEEKIAKAELTVSHDQKTPYFSEGKMILICRKLFAQEIKPESFIASELVNEFYPDKDFHTLYVAEIQKVLVKA